MCIHYFAPISGLGENEKMMKKGDGIHLLIDKNGAVTVPKKMLDSVGLKVGDTVSFDKLDENTILIQKYEEK